MRSMAAVYSSGRRSRREWQSLIERAERSPLSVTAFCAAQGVSTASFYLWRKRLAAEVELPAEFLDLGELQAQVDFLTAHGCQVGQGYFFSEPITALELAQRYFADCT